MDPRYPIGRYQVQPFSEAQKEAWLNGILFLPQKLEMSILNLNDTHFDMPYREGGWQIKQVVHHVADSHMMAYTRFKLALTEENPRISPYKEALWAELSDSSLAVNISITLLHCLHNRWYSILKNMSEEDWQRTLYHPQHDKNISLWDMLAIYAWHGNHHVAHITEFRKNNGL
jgi:hypothetical protein